MANGESGDQYKYLPVIFKLVTQAKRGNKQNMVERFPG